jgi:hypothetical protein
MILYIYTISCLLSWPLGMRLHSRRPQHGLKLLVCGLKLRALLYSKAAYTSCLLLPWPCSHAPAKPQYEALRHPWTWYRWLAPYKQLLETGYSPTACTTSGTPGKRKEKKRKGAILVYSPLIQTSTLIWNSTIALRACKASGTPACVLYWYRCIILVDCSNSILVDCESSIE